MAAVASSSDKTLNRAAIFAVIVITIMFLAPIYWIAARPSSRGR